MSSLTDAELVEGIRNTQEACFNELYARYFQRIYNFTVVRIRNRADAEEVVQETFLRAYRNLGRFLAGSTLYTWLYRIAVNAAVDLAKKRRRRQHLSLDDEGLGFDASLPDCGPAPSSVSERKEMVDLVREGVQALPERYRVILILREYSEMSYEQLAEVLRLPKGTVESRLFRARMKLKDWLERRFGEDGLDLESLGWG